MAKSTTQSIISNSILSDTADAIRQKTNKSTAIRPVDFADEILSITVGGGTGEQTDKLQQEITNSLNGYTNNNSFSLRPYAFYYANIEGDVNLPNLSYVGDNAFSYTKINGNLTIGGVQSVRLGTGAYISISGDLLLPDLVSVPANNECFRNLQGGLQSVSAPNLTEISASFCTVATTNTYITGNINMPKLRTCGTTTSQTCFSSATTPRPEPPDQSVNFPVLETVNCAFMKGFLGLKYIEFPCLTSINGQFCYSIPNLRKADLGRNATSVLQVKHTSTNGFFSGCSNLKTLILRYNGVVSLAKAVGNSSTSNYLYGSGLWASDGYIYVPSGYVDSYKSNANWSALASHFRAIEDYPDICG